MAIELRLPAQAVTASALEELSRANPGYRFERSPDGTLIVAPTGLLASVGEGELFAQVLAFARSSGLGRAFPATGGFTLPDTSIVAPDTTYVTNERLNAIAPADRSQAFVPLVPDAVFELLSTSDDRSATEAKIARYLANGVPVAVLIGPASASVHRPGVSAFEERGARLVVGPEMPGFELDLAAIAAARDYQPS